MNSKTLAVFLALTSFLIYSLLSLFTWTEILLATASVIAASLYQFQEVTIYRAFTLLNGSYAHSR